MLFKRLILTQIIISIDYINKAANNLFQSDVLLGLYFKYKLYCKINSGLLPFLPLSCLRVRVLSRILNAFLPFVASLCFWLSFFDVVFSHRLESLPELHSSYFLGVFCFTQSCHIITQTKLFRFYIFFLSSPSRTQRLPTLYFLVYPSFTNCSKQTY